MDNFVPMGFEGQRSHLVSADQGWAQDAFRTLCGRNLGTEGLPFVGDELNLCQQCRDAWNALDLFEWRLSKAG